MTIITKPDAIILLWTFCNLGKVKENMRLTTAILKIAEQIQEVIINNCKYDLNNFSITSNVYNRNNKLSLDIDIHYNDKGNDYVDGLQIDFNDEIEISYTRYNPSTSELDDPKKIGWGARIIIDTILSKY